MKRFLFAILIFIILGILGFWISNFNWLWKEIIINQSAEISKPILFVENQKETSEIQIFAVGDIMLNRGVEYMIKKHGESDWKFPFSKVADNLQKPDILFGNLESIVSDKGTKVGSIYSFRAEPESIESLKYAGFDILSVANNHIFDYGRVAMEDSFNRLKEAEIDYVGGGFSKNETCFPMIKEIKNTKIAFLAYNNKGSKYWSATEIRSGICWLDEEIVQNIKKAKKLADIVIVSVHWGEEYQSEPNEEQEYFGHLAVDSGADLVIGHHPHVVQPIEEYNQGRIAYSLGNFIFDQGFSEQTMKGLLLEILIKGGEIKKVIPKEVHLNKFFQPEI